MSRIKSKGQRKSNKKIDTFATIDNNFKEKGKVGNG